MKRVGRRKESAGECEENREVRRKKETGEGRKGERNAVILMLKEEEDSVRGVGSGARPHLEKIKLL